VIVGVTGGGGDIGSAICARLAAAADALFVLDADVAKAEQVAERLPNARALALDVTDSQQVEHRIAEIVREHGRLDALINAAGVDDPATKAEMARQRDAGEELDITTKVSDDQWDRLLRINLTGTFYCIRAALGPMLAQRSGSIVNIASMAALIPVPGVPHYSASKAGVLGLTRSIATEVASQGIRVNAVAPGVVDTAMVARWRGKTGLAIPAGRNADVAEIADAVAYLVSPGATYIVGETLNINGGAYMP
jgi:3-oxoacyl-[acyl-carrier protein] reductase